MKERNDNIKTLSTDSIFCRSHIFCLYLTKKDVKKIKSKINVENKRLKLKQ